MIDMLIRPPSIYFENLPFREQIESVEGVSILVGALGTGLFNSLFMKPYSKVIIFVPFGVQQWMGNNIIRMASLHGRQVIPIVSNTPRRNIYKNWEHFVGAEKRFSPNDVYTDPSSIWKFDWLAGFHLFMHQDFYIDEKEFENYI